MTEKKHITVSDLFHGETLEQLVHLHQANVLFSTQGFIPKEKELQQARLIITIGDPEQIRLLAASSQLPDYTPILHLGADDQIPPPIIENTTNRVIDYLPLPVTTQLLLHRISLLVQVQQVGAEYHAHKTTLSLQLSHLSTRDGLTGLFNRRHLTNRLMKIFPAAQKKGKEMSMLLLNIDYFSAINKSLGLEFGDTILNELAARLTESTEPKATCYRFSGEEFVVLLPGTPLTTAHAEATKIRKICSEKPFTDGKNTISLTISVGIASIQDHQPESHNEFLHMVENALYMAKAEGRNRLQIYHSSTTQQKVTPESSLDFLKENLNRILGKTKSSAISSLQLLAKNITGPAHQDHIDSVSLYVALLGKQLGLPEQHIQTFQNSIILYTSFRYLLHNPILAKSENLSQRERKTIEDLPFKLNELTDMFDYFAEERNVLLGHSEHFDGSGYPLGLKGDEISLGARIFNIVDSLAAMNSERPYRRRLSAEEIIEELKKEAGKQFDPYLVLQLFAAIDKNNILQLDPEYLEKAQQDLINIYPKLIP